MFGFVFIYAFSCQMDQQEKRLYMYSNWYMQVGRAPDLLLNLDFTSNILFKFLCAFFFLLPAVRVKHSNSL